MMLRLDTHEGELSLIFSHNNVKIIHGRKVETVSLLKIKSKTNESPFGGQIVFETGSILTYLQVRNEIFLHYLGDTWSFRRKERELALSGNDSPEIKSPMPGKIIQMFGEPGKKFSRGETILILEAMKMENAIKAPFDCQVNQVLRSQGEIVQQDEPLILLDKI
ncbi:acetyl-CoA carboxylase biotin carboxyl carrier protein subunit [Leptospira ilyithenensis]|uniref:Biotin/lipoyl-binding protein n=1 Tax=Leptospira ilyithenensis TaxID=2484901 RepID=A0A4R9LJ21_9LEPT|nr:acetyl-CoA carboxylase biotin carboxyl carrier protein subunit [Leptospira ilyithenensis]TGN06866.1 biotin/lipoyl-binding protein [Leptospira ilyithenensis]